MSASTEEPVSVRRSGSSMLGHDPCRIALLGCGAVSRLYYAPALRQLQDEGVLRLVALYDPDTDAVARLNQAFPSARRLDSAAVVSAAHFDLAIIASPPAFHAEQTIHALSQGVHVLCEKPMAPSAVECAAMVDAARTSDKVLAVGFVRRFFPAVSLIGELLSRQILGQLQSIRIFEGGLFEWPTEYLNYFTRTDSGGGVLLDVGVHTLDLLHSWLGPPRSIAYEDDAMGGIESNCLIQVEYDSGANGVIRLSRDWPQPNKFEFQCSGGYISWDPGETSTLRLKLEGTKDILEGEIVESSTIGDVTGVHSFESAFVAQLRDVLSAIRTRGKPSVTGEVGLENVRLIERLYSSRTLIKMPWLTDEERVAAEKLHRAAR